MFLKDSINFLYNKGKIEKEKEKMKMNKKYHEFFAVALENQSIRLISSQKLINKSFELPEVFEANSPFLVCY